MAKKKKKGLRSFYKNNRIYCILMIISIVCVLGIGISFIVHFTNQSKKSVYGDRLENVENHSLSDDLKALEAFYKENKDVLEISVRIQGKIIHIDCSVNEEFNNTQVESLAVASLEKVSEENLKFYDINFIFIRGERVPYLGYKNSNNSAISWSVYNVTEPTTTTTKKEKK